MTTAASAVSRMSTTTADRVTSLALSDAYTEVLTPQTSACECLETAKEVLEIWQVIGVGPNSIGLL